MTAATKMEKKPTAKPERRSLGKPLTTTEERKEEEAAAAAAAAASKESAVAIGGGGRRKKSSWPNCVINAKSNTEPSESTNVMIDKGTKTSEKAAIKSTTTKPTSLPGKPEPLPPTALASQKTGELVRPKKILLGKTASEVDRGGAELADWKEGCTFRCKSCAFTATLRSELKSHCVSSGHGKG